MIVPRYVFDPGAMGVNGTVSAAPSVVEVREAVGGAPTLPSVTLTVISDEQLYWAASSVMTAANGWGVTAWQFDRGPSHAVFATVA